MKQYISPVIEISVFNKENTVIASGTGAHGYAVEKLTSGVEINGETKKVNIGNIFSMAW